MSEKRSGIEMIEELLQRLNMIEKRLDVMDMNIKTIANSARLSDMINKAASTPLDDWAKAMKPGVVGAEKKGFKNFKFEVTDAAKSGEKRVDPRTMRFEHPDIMVTGKLKIKSGDKIIPLSGISVKIYNEKDEEVKRTKTNRAGEWRCQLSQGPYVALFEGELAGKKLLPQNKNFIVPKKLPDGQKELEII